MDPRYGEWGRDIWDAKGPDAVVEGLCNVAFIECYSDGGWCGVDGGELADRLVYCQCIAHDLE